MFTRRRFLKGSALVTGGAFVTSRSIAAFGATPQVHRGGTLTVAIFADPLSFDPHLTGNIQGRTATQAVHDTLFNVDQHGRLAPGLVESWDQPDSVSYLLHLRKGVRFQDGTPFNAEAVKYNIDRIRNPDIGSIRAGEIRALKTIEVVDDNTVRMTLKYPFAAFLFPFTDVSGCIGSPTAMAKLGTSYGLHPSGTGPFKLVAYQKDTHSILEKNGDYWQKGKPYLDKLILRPIPTDSTRLAELRAGSVQFAEALPLQNIKQLRKEAKFVVSEKAGFRWEYFGFNARSEYPGHAKKFRQAFQWGIDRKALHEIAYFGTGQIGYDGILPSSPFHDPNYKPFTHNVDKAKRLIEESDLNTPITIMGPLRPDPVKQRAAQVFQANAAALGVTVEISQTDSAGYRAQLHAGHMPLDLQGWWGYRPDPDQYLAILLDSSGSYAKYEGYKDPKMDALIAAERQATNEKHRYKVFRQISDLMNEDSVYVPWHYSSDFKGLAKNIRGFVHTASGITDFATIYLAS